MRRPWRTGRSLKSREKEDVPQMGEKKKKQKTLSKVQRRHMEWILRTTRNSKGWNLRHPVGYGNKNWSYKVESSMNTRLATRGSVFHSTGSQQPAAKSHSPTYQAGIVWGMGLEGRKNWADVEIRTHSSVNQLKPQHSNAH